MVPPFEKRTTERSSEPVPSFQRWLRITGRPFPSHHSGEKKPRATGKEIQKSQRDKRARGSNKSSPNSLWSFSGQKKRPSIHISTLNPPLDGLHKHTSPVHAVLMTHRLREKSKLSSQTHYQLLRHIWWWMWGHIPNMHTYTHIHTRTRTYSVYSLR